MIKQRLRSQVPEGSPFSPANLTRLILTVCEFLAEISRQCPPPHRQLEPLIKHGFDLRVEWRGSASRSIGERAAAQMIASTQIINSTITR
jgi:hypothetical protein